MESKGTRKVRRATGTVPSVADQIRASLEEILEAKRSGDFSRMKVRRVEVLEPGQYDARAIRQLRERLQVSQWAFALLVGVSVDLVESWEQGLRAPRPIARRLLDEISRQPKRWRSMVRRSA